MRQVPRRLRPPAPRLPAGSRRSPSAPGTAALAPPAVRAFQSALPARRTLPRSAAVALVARSRHP